LKLLGDRLEARLLEIDQVHLVDGKRDLVDAEQRQDASVPPRLGEHPAPRIDQKHGEVAIRGSGRHVARVLHVARRVGDDEFPPRGREIAIGDVDGDLLLALGLEPVDQQRKIKRPTPRPVRAPRVVLGAPHLVLVDELRVVEQSADQRALAVVDAAAGEKAEQPASLLCRKPRLDPLARVAAPALDHRQTRHQK
jgi:hypothetical protein